MVCSLYSSAVAVKEKFHLYFRSGWVETHLPALALHSGEQNPQLWLRTGHYVRLTASGSGKTISSLQNTTDLQDTAHEAGADDVNPRP